MNEAWCITSVWMIIRRLDLHHALSPQIQNSLLRFSAFLSHSLFSCFVVDCYNPPLLVPWPILWSCSFSCLPQGLRRAQNVVSASMLHILQQTSTMFTSNLSDQYESRMPTFSLALSWHALMFALWCYWHTLLWVCFNELKNPLIHEQISYWALSRHSRV